MIEPITSRRWPSRISSLAALIPSPMPITAIIQAATEHYGWAEAFTVNVLAAGERTAFVERGGKWWRVAETAITLGTTERGDAVRTKASEFSERSCRFCSETFQTRHGKQRFCDSNCKAAHHRRCGRRAA